MSTFLHRAQTQWWKYESSMKLPLSARSSGLAFPPSADERVAAVVRENCIRGVHERDGMPPAPAVSADRDDCQTRRELPRIHKRHLIRWPIGRMCGRWFARAA